MSSILKNVSNEEKLKVTKDIVVAYINNSAEKKKEESIPTLKPEQVCELIKSVYKTVDELLPVSESRVGLH